MLHAVMMFDFKKETKQFFRKGWTLFSHDYLLEQWVSHSISLARKAVNDPKNSKWFRDQNTWFVGVHALNNDQKGSVSNGPVLQGKACNFLIKVLKIQNIMWDKAQISVCYPGYPKPSSSEKQSEFQYRMNRDAAHIDGFLPIGSPKKRFLREYHKFILGIPMVKMQHGHSPFVLWEGSHEIVRENFKKIYANTPVSKWWNIDVTSTYHSIRNQIFEKCRRVEIVAQPGQAYLVHRLIFHGIAPWKSSVKIGQDGRMICYFRPGGSPINWLDSP